MKNLTMYCLTLDPMHENLIENIGYVAVGLGNKKFSKNCLGDNSGNHISKKNPFYGEYTFHYWLWKNHSFESDKWIGFCQYRKFWVNKILDNKVYNNFEIFKKNLLKDIPYEFNNYETILGENFFVNKFKLSKFIKHSFRQIMLDPSLLFNKSKRNILFHFNMMHGHGNLEKAIDLLDLSEKEDFRNFVINENSFNPHNMFICKNSKILFDYYNSVFPWLERCEKVFGFTNLNIYGLKRIYGFLAERYLSYWFKKYTKFKVLPILFKDLTDFIKD